MHDRSRETTVQFLNGKTVTVSTPYMLPKKKGKRRGRGRQRGRRGKGGVGVFPVLIILGVIAGATPALCERATLGIVNNTFNEAEDALRREGVPISAKRLRTISMKFSQAALAERSKRLEAFKRGEIRNTTSVLKGKRVAVTIDGGRLRIRSSIGKRGKRFHTDWREPKVFTIYELDEHGRKKRRGIVRCDGTIDGPEPMIELLAVELAVLGAAEADKVVVIADGAPWIWNHLDTLFALAGIDPSRVTKILDFYHAAEHLKTIAEHLYKSQIPQTRWFNKMRTLLKTRAPAVFMEELTQSIGGKKGADLKRELNYFETNQSRINYRSFKAGKLPIGSGVIESTIRRVVNLRLKGAGMFWIKDNAEGLLHLRCQLKAGTWDEFFCRTLESLATAE